MPTQDNISTYFYAICCTSQFQNKSFNPCSEFAYEMDVNVVDGGSHGLVGKALDL